MQYLLRSSLLVIAVASVALAQRSANASICDYYAAKTYGSNSSDTQFRLMQHIVALAFGGGSGLSGASDESTGILNHGFFDGQAVYLRPWFDGSKATTNLNNQPVGINWMDGGAQQPLMNFLNGSTDAVVLDQTTNEFRLFTHFYTAFGFIFGCTLVRSFPQTNESGGPISLAYVHKYMNLNQTDLGHFINQLTLSSKYFGFSDDDASTLSTYMNSKYNVRCAPAVNGQLYSLCQAPECPLAAPSADCDAYVNLAPGVNGTGGAQQTSAPSSSTSPGSTAASIPTSTGSPPASSPASPSTSNSMVLSSGAIAGIAIGGAAVVLFAIGLWLFFRRRPTKPQMIAVPSPYTGGGGSYASPTHPYHPSYTPTTINPHASFDNSSALHESYLAPGGGAGYGAFFAPKHPSEAELGVPTPAAAGSPHSPPITQIAEMESPQGMPMRGSLSPSRFGEQSNAWNAAGR
ncbi:hypothetical protein HD806DRAFT_515560 [Xylariaceae sp. AK1471]|nr:hypothetical protein HD806DRAFT_515560 [Xylariaceae sp. AK1471]